MGGMILRAAASGIRHSVFGKRRQPAAFRVHKCRAEGQIGEKGDAKTVGGGPRDEKADSEAVHSGAILEAQVDEHGAEAREDRPKADEDRAKEVGCSRRGHASAPPRTHGHPGSQRFREPETLAALQNRDRRDGGPRDGRRRGRGTGQGDARRRLAA